METLKSRLTANQAMGDAEAQTVFGAFDTLSNPSAKTEFDRRIQHELDDWAKLGQIDPFDAFITLVPNLEAKLLQVREWPTDYKLMALDALATPFALLREVNRFTVGAAFDKLLAHDGSAAADMMTAAQLYDVLPPLASLPERYRQQGPEALYAVGGVLTPDAQEAKKQVFVNYVGQTDGYSNDIFRSIALRAAAWGASTLLQPRLRGAIDEVTAKAADLSPRHRETVESVVADRVGSPHISEPMRRVDQASNLLDFARSQNRDT
jgi:hypothetical protein